MTLTTNYTTGNPVAIEKPRKTRIACYERVSTEEQAIHGYSISAQKATLNEYCKAHDYVIIGHYTDEGISGGKPASKRPAMSRLLQDIEHGLIDLVLFCKLDRWFRSVQEYFKVQEVLDAHGCSWNAVQEDYETETANGRMVVSIMLSLAQNEREKASERVRAVFEYRAAKGEFLSGGHAIPYGYKLDGKQLVKDPEREPEVNRLFSLVLSGLPMGTAARIVRSEFPNCNRGYARLRRMLYSPVYAGMRNGVQDVYPAYITVAEYDRIMQLKGTRKPKADDAYYLFSGLLYCPGCGRKMTTTTTFANGKRYVYYICNHARSDLDCPFRTRLAEPRLEKAMTATLFAPGEFIVDSVERVKTARKPAISTATIEAKIKRLAETYTDGAISRDAYKRKLTELTAQLETVRNAPKTAPKPPASLAREILKGDLKTVYNRLTRAEKKRFWRTVLISVKVNSNYIPFDFIFANISD